MAYATASDLAAYLGLTVENLPDGYERLLERASDDLYSLVRRNYDSTNADHVSALNKATCAQVEYLIATGEVSSIQGNIDSFSLGSLSMNFGAGNSFKRAEGIGPRAIKYLNNECLLYRGIGTTQSWSEDV